MITRSKFRIAAVALAASAATSLTWAWFSPLTNSSATPTPPPVSPYQSTLLNVYSAYGVDSQEYQVPPGDSVAGTDACQPNSRTGNLVTLAFATGGGYVMGGQVGDSIASATASYPINAPKSEAGKVEATPDEWRVVVSNPKLADSTVAFRIRMECLEVTFRVPPVS